MRTPTDVLRSLAYYASIALGDDWEIRFEDEEGAFERPFCRINAATPQRINITRYSVIDCKQTYTLVCYPAEETTPVAARLGAETVAELLLVAFARGIKESAYGRKQGSGFPDQSYQRGHPARIPLYAWDGIALDALPDEGTDRDPRDFVAIIEDPMIQVLEGTSREVEEETLYTVTCELRLGWTRSGAILTPGTTAAELHLKPDPS